MCIRDSRQDEIAERTEEETEEEDAGIRDLVLVRRRSLARDLVLVLVLARESDIAGDTEITSHEDDATVARGLARRLREEEGPEVTTTTTMMTIWMMVVKNITEGLSEEMRRTVAETGRRRFRVQGLRMKGEEEEDEVIESTRTRKC